MLFSKADTSSILKALKISKLFLFKIIYSVYLQIRIILIFKNLFGCPTWKMKIQCSVFPSNRISKCLIPRCLSGALSCWAQIQHHNSQLSSLSDTINWLEFTLKMKPPSPLLCFRWMTKKKWFRNSKNFTWSLKWFIISLQNDVRVKFEHRGEKR